MLLSLYKTVFQAGTPWLERYLQKRAAAGKEDPARAHERRGRPSLLRPSGALVWCHAASVGESLSLLSVVRKILEENPSLNVMVTTGTVTSAKLMAERLPQGAFHQYMPVDHPVWTESFLEHWRPDLVIWAESELWPNILMAVQRQKIPAVLLNARMSQGSFRRWRFAGGMIARILKTFSLCLAQNEAEAERLRKLGAENVRVSANLKYASAPLPHDAEKLQELKEITQERPLLLWASTHPGEEEIALRLHRDLKKRFENLLTILVPRHPVRGKSIARLAAERGFSSAVRSDGALPGARREIYIADTLGELGLFFRLAPLCVMGGSFADIGGHNPIEPAQLGCAVIYGPHMYNFISISRDFEQRNAALRVKDEADLKEKLSAFLEFPERFAGMATAAHDFAMEQHRAAGNVTAELTPYLSPLGVRAAA